MSRVHYNALRANLLGALTDSATSLAFTAPLTHSAGVLVPTLDVGDYIPMVILDIDGRLSEVVYVTGYASGGTGATVLRGQDGTTAKAHDAGAPIIGAVLTGDLASFRGEHVPGRAYAEGDSVVAGGDTYGALVPTTTTPPGVDWLAMGSSSSGGGASTLADLTDVDFSTAPTDGQSIFFDEESGTWIPGDAASGGGSGTATADGLGATVTNPITDLSGITVLGGAGYAVVDGVMTKTFASTDTGLLMSSMRSYIGYAEYEFERISGTGWAERFGFLFDVASNATLPNGRVFIYIEHTGTDQWRVKGEYYATSLFFNGSDFTLADAGWHKIAIAYDSDSAWLSVDGIPRSRLEIGQRGSTNYSSVALPMIGISILNQEARFRNWVYSQPGYVVDGGSGGSSTGYEGDYVSGPSYKQNELVSVGAYLWAARTNTTNPPETTTSLGSVDNPTFWSANSVAATDTTAHTVTLVDNGGYDSASLVTLGTTYPLQSRIDVSMEFFGAADEMFIGFIDPAQSETSLTSVGFDGVTGFWGMCFNIWNNQMRSFQNGVLQNVTNVSASDMKTNGSTPNLYSVGFVKTGTVLTMTATLPTTGRSTVALNVTAPSWTAGRVGIASRSGGSSHTCRVYGAPSVAVLGTDWRRIAPLVDLA